MQNKQFHSRIQIWHFKILKSKKLKWEVYFITFCLCDFIMIYCCDLIGKKKTTQQVSNYFTVLQNQMVANNRIFLVPYLQLIISVILGGFLIPSGFVSFYEDEIVIEFLFSAASDFPAGNDWQPFYGWVLPGFLFFNSKTFFSYRYKFCVLN